MPRHGRAGRPDGGPRGVGGGLRLATPIAIAADAAEKARLWKVRKGLYTSVAGSRPAGTTALLEDVCVPVDRLLETCEGLTELFARHSYDSSVIFGHARDGNIHFMINERFNEPASVTRYEAFTADMVDLVLAQDGNLKAEHGTGPDDGAVRGTAVRTRPVRGDAGHQAPHRPRRPAQPWRGAAGGRRVDPARRRHAQAAGHGGGGGRPLRRVRLLRTRLPVEGHHAHAAPADHTAPRHGDSARLGEHGHGRRAGARLRVRGHRHLRRRRDVRAGVPGLDQHRRPHAAPAAGGGQPCTGRHLGTRRAGVGDRYARWRVRSGGGRQAAGRSRHRHHRRRSQGGGRGRHAAVRRHAAWRRLAARAGKVGDGSPQAVYVPACIQTMFGPESGGDGVMAAFRELCERAAVTLEVPKGIGSMCCGTPWKSKGYVGRLRAVSDRTLPQLWDASGHGRLPSSSMPRAVRRATR